MADDLDATPTADPVVVTEFGARLRTSTSEIADVAALAQIVRSSPIPDDELASNLGLYLRRQTLSRLLCFIELYRMQIDVHGVVAEFGVRWGQTLALLLNLRGIFEPYNNTRRIVGFDTFTGFPDVGERDGHDATAHVGAFRVQEQYESDLRSILELHARNSPNPHLSRFDLVQGDASQTIGDYLTAHPETIFSFVYFDFDLYEPTRAVLAAIRGRLTKGSVVGFDELCVPMFPGETEAVMDELGLPNVRLRRFPFDSNPSYFVVE